MSLESLFCDQDLVSSITIEKKIIEQEINKSTTSQKEKTVKRDS